MHDWLLENASHFMLDMCFVAEDTALHSDSLIAALNCVHCQNLHIGTTTTTITSKCIHNCSVCSKTWYESQVVKGNPFALLGVIMV